MGSTFASNTARLPLRCVLSSSSACAASEQNVGWERTVSWTAELILRWSRSSLRGACRGGSLKSSLYSSNHVWTKVNRRLREQEAKLSTFNYFWQGSTTEAKVYFYVPPAALTAVQTCSGIVSTKKQSYLNTYFVLFQKFRFWFTFACSQQRTLHCIVYQYYYYNISFRKQPSIFSPWA